MQRCYGICLLASLLMVQASAFEARAFRRAPCPTKRVPPVVRCCEPPEDELTKVGSKAYYEGFFTQPVNENVTAERGDGTEQAVKFAASSFVVIAALFLGFMASNGLLG